MKHNYQRRDVCYPQELALLISCALAVGTRPAIVTAAPNLPLSTATTLHDRSARVKQAHLARENLQQREFGS
jgi:hypothetical protein